ncbi:MAG: V-type ATPase subunit [Candidatus Micrarchaeota archaeon]|nr:V-type ATPase subunit [Candidatus Micrarchaeota archaeon]
MDSTYVGAYGRISALKSDLLGPQVLDQLNQKDIDEFTKTLSNTSYRKEVDSFSGMYKGADLVSVVLSAHMMRMIKAATSPIPPLAKNFVDAYLSKWDIENIKLILSSKRLGYEVEKTESFLMVNRNVPVGTFSGVISREDYINMINQKDIEGVINSLVKYGYGTVLLKYIDEAKSPTGTLDRMFLALDLYYFNRLVNAFRMYNGDESPVLEFIKDGIDIRNSVTAIKMVEFGYKDIKEYIIPGGHLAESKLVEMASKDLQSIRNELPFRIDAAFDLYKKEQFVTYLNTALEREMYRKYLKTFGSLALSLESIMSFILRCELERYELRAIWLSKLYRLSSERYEGMRMLKYVM